MSLFSDEKLKIASPITVDAATQGYGGTYKGVTLTTGDLPLLSGLNSSGAIFVVVLTSGNAVAVRT